MFSGVLIDDAEFRQDVAATKQAARIDSRWDLQSPRIFEEIFFWFLFALHLGGAIPGKLGPLRKYLLLV